MSGGKTLQELINSKSDLEAQDFQKSYEEEEK
jgi:hypothetical protein